MAAGADKVVNGISLRSRARLVYAMEQHGLSQDAIVAIFEDSGLNDPVEGETDG